MIPLSHLRELLGMLDDAFTTAHRRDAPGVFMSYSAHDDVRRAIVEIIEARHRRSLYGPDAPPSDHPRFTIPKRAPLTLAQLEQQYIEHVLALESGHQERAARRLGITRKTIYRKLRQIECEREIAAKCSPP